MRFCHRLVVLGVLGCFSASRSEAWFPGTYPAPPARMHTRGFVVDTSNRNDVLAFWHAVYMASEGYRSRIGWTGDYAGNNGSVSASFAGDVERRLNFMRAMCGVPATARVNTGTTVFLDPSAPYAPAGSTTKTAAAQAAALMLIRNYNPSTGSNPAISHDPPDTCTGWSAAAWNANANGNLAFGLYGPGAVDQYMLEELPKDAVASTWNVLTGHRRWCLYPPATDFATGDQPGESAFRPATNVLYVMQNDDELNPPAVENFVAYPPAGFCPGPLNTRFWSLSMVGADFRDATVNVTTSTGAAVGVSGVTADSSFGDPALIWEVDAAAASKAVYADRSYTVNVSNFLVDGVPTSHTYRVTFINPDRLIADQSVKGPGFARSNVKTTFTFTPPVGAEAVRITTFTKSTTAWKLDGETLAGSKVIDRTDPSYPVVVAVSNNNGFGIAGNKLFRLTFPVAYDLVIRGVPQQIIELDRDLLPDTGAMLTFKFRRGFMTRSSVLSVEASSDGGVSWTRLGTPITGVSDNRTDDAPTSTSRAIPRSSNPVRIRFRYYHTSGSIFTHETYPQLPTGIFLDDISTVKCKTLQQRKTHTLNPTTKSFAFSSTTAGATLRKGDWWGLRMATKLGGRWFPYGPVKPVVISAP